MYLRTCASEMEGCGMLTILGMVKVDCGASSNKTGLFIIKFFQSGKRDGSWPINYWMLISF